MVGHGECGSGPYGILTSKTIEGTALAFESIDYIHCCYCLPLGMFRVRHRVSDDVLQEHLENASGLLVDESRDALHTTSASQSANCRFGNSLDVITEDLAMPFCTSFSESLSSFASSSHCCMMLFVLIDARQGQSGVL